MKQNFSYGEVKKFKIIAEETPIHCFYETEEFIKLAESNNNNKSNKNDKGEKPAPPAKPVQIAQKEETSTQPKIIGSDVEIITKIFTKLKIPFEIEIVHWTQVVPKLISGEADMAIGIEKTKKNEKRFYFTRTPMRSKNYSFYGLESQLKKDEVMTFEDALLLNYRVGIMVGFTYPKEFWDAYPFENKLLNSHLFESKTFRDNMIKLKEKKIDLFIGDRERVNVILKKIGAEETIFQYKNILYWKDYFFVYSKKLKAPNIDKIKVEIERELYKMTESEEIPAINLSWIKKGT